MSTSRGIRIVLVHWILALVLASISSISAQEVNWAPEIILDTDRVSYETFWSPTVNAEVGYTLLLPPSYETEPERRYSVSYWLHGSGGSPLALARIYEPFEQRMLSGDIPEMIMIGCQGMLRSWYLDGSDGEIPVESVIINDLIPFIDKNYRTLPNRYGRVIEGSSMGGYGAMRFGLKYPELFASIGSISTGRYDQRGGYNELRRLVTDFSVPLQSSLYPNESLLARGSTFYINRNSPMSILLDNHEKVRGRTKIRLIIGAEDSLHIDGMRLFHNILNQYGMITIFETVPNLGHGTIKILLEDIAEMNFFYDTPNDQGDTTIYPGWSVRFRKLNIALEKQDEPSGISTWVRLDFDPKQEGEQFLFESSNDLMKWNEIAIDADEDFTKGYVMLPISEELEKKTFFRLGILK